MESQLQTLINKIKTEGIDEAQKEVNLMNGYHLPLPVHYQLNLLILLRKLSLKPMPPDSTVS